MNEGKQMVETKHCDSADDFLFQLGELDGEGWYFRGQSSDAYRLVPTLWRSSAKDGESGREIEVLFEKFCSQFSQSSRTNILFEVGRVLSDKRGYEGFFDDIPSDRIVEFLMRVRFESYLLAQFYSTCNSVALKVPDNFMTEYYLYDPKTWCGYHSNRGLSHSLGGMTDGSLLNAHLWAGIRGRGTLRLDASLPQHYGLPTRLLDWTANRKKAAFFSINPLSINQNNKNGRVAVFAIRINKHCAVRIDGRHLRYENNFLHAQGGVFTDNGGYGERYFLQKGEFPSLEDMRDELAGGFISLKKFTLSKLEVPNLSEKLRQDEIFLSSMKPHYTSVAAQVKDELYMHLIPSVDYGEDVCKKSGILSISRSG